MVYPGTMYSALFLFALSYGATAPPETDQTTLLLLDSENADAPFTPLNMFGSTAVFPAMFQLGSGAGGDSEVIRSLVSLDPRPDTSPVSNKLPSASAANSSRPFGMSAVS